MRKLALWVVAISAWGGEANAMPVISDKLVAHYDFNGNANDSSATANHGTEFGDIGKTSCVFPWVPQ